MHASEGRPKRLVQLVIYEKGAVDGNDRGKRNGTDRLVEMCVVVL